jgi:membrane-associated phospholipid phosphatase
VLDEHWMTDVLVGAAIGVAAALLAGWSVRASRDLLGFGWSRGAAAVGRHPSPVRAG